MFSTWKFQLTHTHTQCKEAVFLVIGCGFRSERNVWIISLPFMEKLTIQYRQFLSINDPVKNDDEILIFSIFAYIRNEKKISLKKIQN